MRKNKGKEEGEKQVDEEKETHLAPWRRTALKINSSAYCGSLNLILAEKRPQKKRRAEYGDDHDVDP